MSRLKSRGELYAKDSNLTWQKFKPCYVCGQPVCYNNYPDHLGRQKRFIFRGFFLCPSCDPRGFAPGNKRRDDVIYNRSRYRVILALQVMQKLKEMPCVSREAIDCGKCPACLARKIDGIKI